MLPQYCCMQYLNKPKCCSPTHENKARQTPPCLFPPAAVGDSVISGDAISNAQSANPHQAVAAPQISYTQSNAVAEEDTAANTQEPEVMVQQQEPADLSSVLEHEPAHLLITVNDGTVDEPVTQQTLVEPQDWDTGRPCVDEALHPPLPICLTEEDAPFEPPLPNTVIDTRGAGYLQYQDWWFLREVDIAVCGHVLTGTPIFLHSDTLRVVNNHNSYFVPLGRIDYIRSNDGLEF